MKVSSKHIENGNAFNELLPLLAGKVFHVTKENNWLQIESSQIILPTPDIDKHERTFGTKSYFQQRNCVCLFDYRNFYEEKQQNHYYKCLPTKPLEDEHPIRILFLNQAYYNKLIPYKYSEWKTNGIGTNVVPYVETGFEGGVPLNYIEEALKVTITEDKNSISYILKRTRMQRDNG